jgi:hypothetical protein
VKRKAPTLHFGSYYVTFGVKFLLGVVVIAVIAVIVGLIKPSGGWEWVVPVSNLVEGAVLGVILQPLPESKSNKVHADFAVTSLVSTARSISSSRSAVSQLVTSGKPDKYETGLILVGAELEATLSRLLASISEWDRIEPGSSERAVEEVKKQILLADQLGIEEAHAEEN